MPHITICTSQGVSANGRLLKLVGSFRHMELDVKIIAGKFEEPTALQDADIFIGPKTQIRLVSRSSFQSPNFITKLPTFLQRITNGVAFRYYRLRLSRELRAARSDIWFFMDLDVLAASRHLLAGFKGKAIFDSGEYFADTAGASPAQTQYVRKIIAQTSNKLDSILTVNNRIAKELRSEIHAKVPVYLLRNLPIFLARDSHGSGYNGQLHSAANLPNSQKILLYHGGFSAKRGLEELVYESRKLPADWSLILMGSGALESELSAIASEARKAGHDNSCYLLPPCPFIELPEWISGATIGLIPYQPGPRNHNWATPNKLYEFPAAGVPVLASDLELIQEQIEDHQFGWTLPAKKFARHYVGLIDQLTDSQIDLAAKNALAFAKKHSWAEQEPVLRAALQLQPNSNLSTNKKLR